MTIETDSTIAGYAIRSSARLLTSICLVVLSIAAAQADESAPASLAGQLLSAKKEVRDQTRVQLGEQYRSMCDGLLAALHEAAEKHADDHRYLSPLHCAIVSVGQWRVFEAQDTLIRLIDYQLDSSSLHFMNPSGSFFYPAAGALVDMQVDPRKVLIRITKTEDDLNRRLLTWVLMRRTSSADEARRLLRGEVSNESVQKALQLLDQAQNRPDLLLREARMMKSTPDAQTNSSSAGTVR
jgi:hypothetical protein